MVEVVPAGWRSWRWVWGVMAFCAGAASAVGLSVVAQAAAVVAAAAPVPVVAAVVAAVRVPVVYDVVALVARAWQPPSLWSLQRSQQ